MKIAIGSDHRGYNLKEHIKQMLLDKDYQIIDLGTGSDDSVDYPDFGIPVAEEVASGQVDRGIVMCASGIGMSIAANKVPGVRAALCRTIKDAELTRKHNDSNVLALSEEMLGEPGLEELVMVWLSTPFEGGRHSRRVDKIIRYENSVNKRKV